METNTHKLLDVVEHLWPYISGLILTMVVIVKMWWYNHNEVKRRINTLEKLAEMSATKIDLHECKAEVSGVDNANLEKIYNKLSEQQKDNAIQQQNNAKEHQDILQQMLRLHSKD